MKQNQLVEAYKAICKLTNIPMDLRTSYEIMKLKKQLTDHYEFEKQEETKAFQQFHGEFLEDGKTMKFPTAEDKNEFWKQVTELKNMDVDIDINPVRIDFDQKFQLTPGDMEALDEFILFE